MQLWLEFQKKKKRSLLMVEYILRIKNISNNLAAIGESVSEMDQILQLLAGLRANYNSIVASLI